MEIYSRQEGKTHGPLARLIVTTFTIKFYLNGKSKSADPKSSGKLQLYRHEANI